MVGALDRKMSDADFTSTDVQEKEYWVGTDVLGLEKDLESSRYFEKVGERNYEGPGFDVFVVEETESPTDDAGVAYSFDPGYGTKYLEAVTEFAAGILNDRQDVAESFADEVEKELRGTYRDMESAYDTKKVRHRGRVPSGRRERQYEQEFRLDEAENPEAVEAFRHFFGSKPEKKKTVAD